MKFKRIVSKILACAMVVTTVFTGNVTSANAANEDDLTLQPLAEYDFETEDNYKDIELVTGAAQPYTGTISLTENGYNSVNAFDITDPAVPENADRHGLKLPQKNLTEYTVSLWMWRQWNSVDSSGGSYVVMSIGTPDKYISLKAKDGVNENYLYLYSGGKSDDTIKETSLGMVDTPQKYWAQWHRLTLTQSGNEVKVYWGPAGKVEDAAPLTVTLDDDDESLLDENGRILIGVQHKGGTNVTKCRFDDISVYDAALNAKQIQQLYKGETVTKSEESILKEKGITVSPTDGAVIKGKAMKVQAVLPTGVAADTNGLEISYASANTNIAEVNSTTGVVTGKALGNTKITVTAKIGAVTKTAEMELAVVNDLEGILAAAKKINVPEKVTCSVGGTAQIELQLPTGLKKDDVEISYKVSDGTVASVDQTGKVTGIKAGTANVVTSVKLGDTTKTGTTEVKVLGAADILEAGEITVTPNVRIKGTGTAQINVISLPTGLTADDVSVSYALKPGAATGVATVNATTGVVTGTAAGGRTIVTTTVTATTNGNTVTKTADTIVKVLGTAVNADVAVEYDLSTDENGKLKDMSNHNNDGVIRGENYSFETTAEADIMTLGDETWIELPSTIRDTLSDIEQFTISATFAKGKTNGTNAWLYCFGSDVQPEGEKGINYLFLCPDNGGKLRSGIKDSTTEKVFDTTTVFTADKFYTVDMVFDNGKISLYVDGIKIKGTDGDCIDSKFKMADILDANTTEGILGYIGKSVWPGDKIFQGKLSSFKIYNSIVDESEIQAGHEEEFKADVEKKLTDTVFNGFVATGESVNAVVTDLSLPSTIGQYNITWSSAPEGIIAADGTVYNDDTADKEVKLTATVTSGSMTTTKEFTVTVKKADKEALQAAIDAAQAKIDTGNYTAKSVAALQKYLDQAATVKGQKNIDALTKNIKTNTTKLVLAPGDHDPFGKITSSNYLATVTLAPTKKTATAVFTLPDTLKLDTDVTVSYESSDPTVATVDDAGVVTAQKKRGTTTITTKVTALWEGLSGDDAVKEYKTTVTVDVDMTAVNATAKATKLAKGKNTTITATPTADMVTAGYVVSYNASGAVTVNATGKVTAKKSGTGSVTVTFTSLGKTNTKTISFTVGEITGKSSVKVKKSITLKVKGIKGKVNWSLDKKSKKLAKINKKGKLTAKKKKGTVTVTAKVNGLTITKKIKIKK